VLLKSPLQFCGCGLKNNPEPLHVLKVIFTMLWIKLLYTSSTIYNFLRNNNLCCNKTMNSVNDQSARCMALCLFEILSKLFRRVKLLGIKRVKCSFCFLTVCICQKVPILLIFFWSVFSLTVTKS